MSSRKTPKGFIPDVTKRTNPFHFHFETADVLDSGLDDEQSHVNNTPDIRIDNLLTNWDLVLVIEHCCNCNCHAASLRHDSDKYSSTANNMLRHLANVVSDAQLRVRCGVLRLNITNESRIGAFEVFVFFRNRTGTIYRKKLFSKLDSTLWPTKKTLEKNLLEFVVKMRILKYSQSSTDFTRWEADQSLMVPYPVGYGSWLLTLLADPRWEFPIPLNQDIIHAKNGGKPLPPSLPQPPKDLRVMWVFDSREVEPFRPKPGQLVRVSKMHTARGARERQSLVGTFIRYCNEIPLDNEGEYCQVQLKYTDEMFIVRLSTITDYDIHHQKGPYSGTTEFPEELLLVLLMCRSRREKTGSELTGVDEGSIEEDSRKSIDEGNHKLSPSGKKLLSPRQASPKAGKTSPKQSSSQNGPATPASNTQPTAVHSPGVAGPPQPSRHHYHVGVKFVDWVASGNGDMTSLDRIYLSRRSLFLQLRDVVCDVERIIFPHLAISSRESRLVYHPVTGNTIDLQQCYSEEVLDWVYSADISLALGNTNAEPSSPGDLPEGIDIRELEHLAGKVFCSKLNDLVPANPEAPHYAMPLQTYLLRHCIKHELNEVLASNTINKQRFGMKRVYYETPNQFADWLIKLMRSSLLTLCGTISKYALVSDDLESLHHIVRMLDLRKLGYLDFNDIRQIVYFLYPEVSVNDYVIGFVFDSIELTGSGNVTVDEMRRFLICRNDFTVEIGLIRPILSSHLQACVDSESGSPNQHHDKDSEHHILGNIRLSELFTDTLIRIAYTKFNALSHLEKGWEHHARSAPTTEVFGQFLLHFGVESVMSEESLMLIIWSFCFSVSSNADDDMDRSRLVNWFNFLTWVLRYSHPANEQESDEFLYSTLCQHLLQRAVQLLHSDQSCKLVEPVLLIWNDPESIVYGTRLSSLQLNASLSHSVAPGTDEEIRGEFRYFPGGDELLDAGNHILRVSFVPLDSTRFPLLEKTVSITVNKIQPIISWPENLGTIEIGNELDNVQLNAMCLNPVDNTILDGSFFYSRSFGFSFSKIGIYEIEARFIPNSWNFAQVVATSHIKVLPRSTVGVAAKLEPTIIWDDSKNPPLKVGDELSEVHLHATIAEEGVLGQFFYSKPYDYVFSKPGNYEITATFVPQEPFDWKYKQVSKSISIRVIRKDPLKTMIIWEQPEPIVYGTLLNSVQLNAMCVDVNNPDEVPGTYRYSHQDGMLLDPGDYSIELSFIPDDPTAYAAAHADVVLTVLQITPIIEWEPYDGPFYIGEPLNEKILNARCVNGVEGEFSYSRKLGHVYTIPGQYEMSVTFLPQDMVYYARVSQMYTLTVLRPITLGHIEWENPAEIPFGTPLSTTQLNARFVVDATGELVPGIFVYTPEHWALLEGGTQVLTVEFTPLEDCNLDLKYEKRKSVLISVGKIAPVVRWVEHLGQIEMGVELTDALLNARAYDPLAHEKDRLVSLEGSFFYSKGLGYCFTRAGKHEIVATFLPSEANSKNFKQNSCSAIIEVVSAVSDMELVWPFPENIEYGDALSMVQLNALVVDRSTGEFVPGDYIYNPEAGTILDAGRQMISVEFRPKARPEHLMTKSVEIIINKKMPTLIWPDPVPEPLFVGEKLSEVQLNAYCGPSHNLEGTITYSHLLGQAFSSPGTYEIIATFNSSTPNYYQAVRIVKLKVVPKIQEVHSTLHFSNPPSIYYGTVLADDHLHAVCRDTHSKDLVEGAYLYHPPHGAVLPAGVHELFVEFIPTNAGIYSVLNAKATIIVHKAEPTIEWEITEDTVFVGQDLTESVLNATVEEEIYGHFFYSRSIGFAFSKPGQYEITVTFVPGDEDSKNFKQASKTVEFYVRMPDPKHIEIEWENPTNIPFGTPLTHTQLCARCVSGDDESRSTHREKIDVPGNFQYFPHLGHVLPAGVHELRTEFTFINEIKYGRPIIKSVYITVEKNCPTLIWEEPAVPIVVGQRLTKEQHLTAYCVDNITGSFLYTPPAETEIVEAGYHILSVLFFPHEPYADNYRQCSAQVHLLAIESERPHQSVSAEIIWDAPAAISFGTRLTTAQLNARCLDKEFGTDVDGRFEYLPNFGDILGEGSHTLKLIFFPDHKRKYGEVYSHEVTIEVFDPVKLQQDSPSSMSKYSMGLRGLVKHAGEIVDPTPMFHSRKLVFHRMIVDGRVLKRAKFGDVIVRLRVDGEEFSPVEMYKFDKVDTVINFHFESKSLDFTASDFLTKQMTITIKGRSMLKGNRVEFTAGAAIPLKQLMDVNDGPFHVSLFAYPKLYLTDVRTVIADEDVNSKCKLRISLVAHAFEPKFTPADEITDKPLPAPTFVADPDFSASRKVRPSSANASGRMGSSLGGRASYASPYTMLNSFGAETDYGFGKSTGPSKKLFHSPAAPMLPSPTNAPTPNMQQYRDLLVGASPKSPSVSPSSRNRGRPRPRSAPQGGKRSGTVHRPLIPVVVSEAAAVVAMREVQHEINEDTIGRWPESAQGKSDLKLANRRPLPTSRPHSAGSRSGNSPHSKDAAHGYVHFQEEEYQRTEEWDAQGALVAEEEYGVTMEGSLY